MATKVVASCRALSAIATLLENRARLAVEVAAGAGDTETSAPMTLSANPAAAPKADRKGDSEAGTLRNRGEIMNWIVLKRERKCRRGALPTRHCDGEQRIAPACHRRVETRGLTQDRREQRRAAARQTGDEGGRLGHRDLPGGCGQ